VSRACLRRNAARGCTAASAVRAAERALRAGGVPAQPRGRDVRHEVRRARHRGASLPRRAARAAGAETLTLLALAAQGGGRSSARETIGRVAAGAIAKKILAQVAGVEILAFVSAVRDVRADDVDLDTFTMEQVEDNIVRCPDAQVAERMIAAIDEVRPCCSRANPTAHACMRRADLAARARFACAATAAAAW
jgi:hypothetical protein